MLFAFSAERYKIRTNKLQCLTVPINVFKPHFRVYTLKYGFFFCCLNFDVETPVCLGSARHLGELCY